MPLIAVTAPRIGSARQASRLIDVSSRQLTARLTMSIRVQ